MSKQKDRITIADVAEKANVSTMTVSRVLNNKGEISEATRQHVLTIMSELGYRPNRVAQSLATDRTLKVGIVVPALSSYYFGAILEGTEDVLWEHGYHILLCNTGDNRQREKAVMEFFEEDRVDGVIIFSSHLTPHELTAYLDNQRAAVVMNTQVNSTSCSSILVDEHSAMSIVVQHLVSRNRSKLGFVGIRLETYAARERWNGFIAALEAAGLKPEPQYMAECSDNGWAGAYDTAKNLLNNHPEIEGLVCFNDNVAAGVIRACHDLQINIPNDVAVIGYDDVFLAEVVTPSLTTLRLSLSKREVGELAARMLLDRIEGTVGETKVLLDHELVIRDSAP